MTIVVKTNSYLSVVDADAYWLARNGTKWAAASTAQKEKALIEATQYIDGAYVFLGNLTSYSQPLAWPRSGVVITQGNFAGAYYQSDVLPQALQNATAELANEAISSRLRPAQDRGGAIKRKKVDVIEVEYSDTAPNYKTYDFVSMLLASLLTNGGDNYSVALTRV